MRMRACVGNLHLSPAPYLIWCVRKSLFAQSQWKRSASPPRSSALNRSASFLSPQLSLTREFKRATGLFSPMWSLKCRDSRIIRLLDWSSGSSAAGCAHLGAGWRVDTVCGSKETEKSLRGRKLQQRRRGRMVQNVILVFFRRRLSQRPAVEELESRNILKRECQPFRRWGSLRFTF